MTLPRTLLISLCPSILQSIDPYFGVGVGARGDSQIKTVEAFPLPSKVSGRARAHNGRNLGNYIVVIGIGLLINPDGTRAPRHVNALALGAVIQIVRVLNGRDGGDHFARARVEHGERRRFPRAYDDAVIGFIESHWKVLAHG